MKWAARLRHAAHLLYGPGGAGLTELSGLEETEHGVAGNTARSFG